MVDISVWVGHIIIWKQTILKSQWLNTQQFIYLFSQGLLRVQATFQGSCLPCGNSEPQANWIMWHVHNKFFHDCCGSEERVVCTVLQVLFSFEFIFHPYTSINDEQPRCLNLGSKTSLTPKGWVFPVISSVWKWASNSFHSLEKTCWLILNVPCTLPESQLS